MSKMVYILQMTFSKAFFIHILLKIAQKYVNCGSIYKIALVFFPVDPIHLVKSLTGPMMTQ